MSDKIKVILPVSQIPEGSMVHKVKGEAMCRLVHEVKVRVFGSQEDGQRGAVIRGGYMLIPDKEFKGTLNIQAVSGEYEMVWVTDEEELCQFLSDRYNERYSK